MDENKNVFTDKTDDINNENAVTGKTSEEQSAQNAAFNNEVADQKEAGNYFGAKDSFGNASAESAPATEENTPRPVNAPAGRYVYYPDGSRAFVPYGQPTAAPANKKQGKAKYVAVTVMACILVACLTVFATLVIPKLLDSKDSDENSKPLIGTNVDSSVEESIAEELSVPEIVTVSPLPGQSYDDLVSVYENCADSCVTILCQVTINTGFFPQTGQSLGSGFIIEGEKDGKKGLYIVTNHHVIDGADKIEVKFNDGEIYKATLLGSDELTDIAVLSTERTDVKPIPMGDSKNLKVGQTVVAIGTPSEEELQNTMSYGIVSGLNREIKMANDYGSVVKTMTVIQTTATLNPGNSGGPLINMAGQVIGINAMKLMQDYEGIGFALPSTEASHIINSLIEYGKVIEGGDSFVSGTAQLGISGYTVDAEVREQLELGEDCPDGIVVATVNRGTAVYEAGLSIYDVITEFNGKRVKTMEELKELLEQSKAGTQVSLTFYRIGRRGEESGYQTIKFKLDAAK